MEDDVVIVAATRTAVGKFGGSLAKIPAAELGAKVIKSLLQKSGLKPDQVSEVIMGQVLTAGDGQNPARQASLKGGLPDMVPAMTIGKVCGSGLKAVHLATQAIKCGDADIVIAGGQENMSASAHVLKGSRDGFRMGDAKLVDTMIVDGLWDVYNQYHMGNTAENIAKKYEVSREEQDAFAAASQNKAEAAQKAGKFKEEITPVEIPSKKGTTVFDTDEFVKHGVTTRVTGGFAARIQQGRQRHCRQCVRAERRRGSGGPDEGVKGQGTGLEAAGEDQGLFIGGRRSKDHGHGAGAGERIMPAQGRLETRGSGPDGDQRSLCRAGDRRQQADGLGHVQDQRQRRCHRHWPPDRRLRRAHPRHIAA